jgi:hypothetical protein
VWKGANRYMRLYVCACERMSKRNDTETEKWIGIEIEIEIRGK